MFFYVPHIFGDQQIVAEGMNVRHQGFNSTYNDVIVLDYGVGEQGFDFDNVVDELSHSRIAFPIDRIFHINLNGKHQTIDGYLPINANRYVAVPVTSMTEVEIIQALGSDIPELWLNNR